MISAVARVHSGVLRFLVFYKISCGKKTIHATRLEQRILVLHDLHWPSDTHMTAPARARFAEPEHLKTSLSLCSDEDSKQMPGSLSNVEQFSLVHQGSDLLVADYRASPCFGKTCTNCAPSRRVVTIHELETGLPSEVIIATALIMEYFEERRTGQRDHLPSALAP